MMRLRTYEDDTFISCLICMEYKSNIELEAINIKATGRIKYVRNVRLAKLKMPLE